jgi:hypothetical protein
MYAHDRLCRAVGGLYAGRAGEDSTATRLSSAGHNIGLCVLCLLFHIRRIVVATHLSDGHDLQMRVGACMCMTLTTQLHLDDCTLNCM